MFVMSNNFDLNLWGSTEILIAIIYHADGQPVNRQIQEQTVIQGTYAETFEDVKDCFTLF